MRGMYTGMKRSQALLHQGLHRTFSHTTPPKERAGGACSKGSEATAATPIPEALPTRGGGGGKRCHRRMQEASGPRPRGLKRSMEEQQLAATPIAGGKQSHAVGGREGAEQRELRWLVRFPGQAAFAGTGSLVGFSVLCLDLVGGTVWVFAVLSRCCVCLCDAQDRGKKHVTEELPLAVGSGLWEWVPTQPRRSRLWSVPCIRALIGLTLSPLRQRSCSECDDLCQDWRASPVWFGGSALTSWTVHHCRCVSDTLTLNGTS